MKGASLIAAIMSTVFLGTGLAYLKAGKQWQRDAATSLTIGVAFYAVAWMIAYAAVD